MNRPPLHRGHVALSVCGALMALVAVIGIALHFGERDHERNTLQNVAARASKIVSADSTTSCNPPLGAGKLGSCAPIQAFEVADAVGKAAGDPDNITGHPLGVDVSSNNGCNHFTGADAFVFIKATESTTYTNPCFAGDVARAKALGITYGAYDFLRAGSSTPVAEAQHFVSAVNAANANTSLPPVADVEVNAGLSPAQLHAYVDSWESYVKAALHRTVVITYTGAWFWTPEVGGTSEGDLWVSGYGSSVTSPASWTQTQTVAPFGPIAWKFWQYSDGTSGPTPHLSADSDVFGGTQAQLDQLAGIKTAGSSSTTAPIGATTPRMTTGVQSTASTSNAVTKTSSKPVGNYLYTRFTKPEAAMARSYDNLRVHPKTNAAALKPLRKWFLSEARLIYRRAHNVKPNRKPSWGEFWRGWRFQQQIRRSQGAQIEPNR